MPDFAPIPAGRFYEDDPRRDGSRQLDYCFFRSEDGQCGMRTTWIEATGEVCALIGGGSHPEAFILLGNAPSYRCLEAVLEEPPSHDTSIVWVAEMLEQIPDDPRDVESLVAAYNAGIRAEAEDEERRDLASFEVVELASLPETDEEQAERYGEEDWPAIASIAVELSESGVSPRDDASILARGEEELTEEGCGLLRSLFRDPIAIPLEASAFINGRHRTAAMRAAGVRRCVIHTDRGRR